MLAYIIRMSMCACVPVPVDKSTPRQINNSFFSLRQRKFNEIIFDPLKKETFHHISQARIKFPKRPAHVKIFHTPRD